MRGLSAIVLFGALLSSCTVDTPTPFGQHCTNPDICGGLQCRPSPTDGELRCLPPRGPAEPGEQCAAPFVTTSPGTGKTILDQLVYLGGAVDDVQLSCSAVEAPEVVLRFTVADDDGDAATEAPGVRIRLDGDNADHFALSLRAAGCGDELAFGCKAPGASDILLQALPPGEYELVVEGTAVGAGVDEQPAHVVVERLDCPPNALPFDANNCIRNVRLGANLAPRVGHSVHVLDDGSIVVIGGDSGGGARSDFEVLDPTSGRWAFGSLAVGGATTQHASLVLDDNRILILGGNLGNAQVLDVTAFRSAQLSSQLGRSTSNLPGSEVVAVRMGDRVFSASNKFGTEGLGLVGGTFIGSLNCQRENCAGFTIDRHYETSYHYTEGLSLLAASDQLVVVSGVLFDSLGTAVTGPLTIASVGAESFTLRAVDNAVDRSSAALVAPNRQQVLIVGGVNSDGTLSREVERYDFSTRRIERLPPLPVDVTHPRATMLGDLVLIVGDESTPLLMNPETGEQLRAPDILARAGSRLATADSAITIIGGQVDGTATAAVERLELVGRTARVLDVPGCFATTLTDSGTITGSTEGRDDLFRSERCSAFAGGVNYGRDELYRFTLDEPGSLRVTDMTDDDSYFGNAHRLVLLRGQCKDGGEAIYDDGLGFAYEEVACGDGEGNLSLFAGDLPAGDYTLVFEHAVFDPNDEAAPFAGAGFSATILLGPPLTCPLDAADPIDDTVPGATPLASVSDDDPGANGRLCPDDVDHLIFERGERDSVGFDGIPDDSVAFLRAVVDVDASIAAGRPIASDVVGDPLPNLDDAPAGVYVARLAGPAEQVDFIEWAAYYQLSCARDAGDSYVPELDNANVAFAETLEPGDDTLLLYCDAADRDTVILDPAGNTGPMTLRISNEPNESRIELFAITNGALGEPLSLAVVPDPRSEFDSFVDLGVLTEPIAVRVSLVGDDEGSRTIDFAALQEGDLCENALPLVTEAAQSGTLTGSVARFSADLDAVVLGDCTGFREPGRDTVFAVELDAGATLELLATGLDADADSDGINDGQADLAVYVLKDCDGTETSCVAGIDAANRGEPESLTFTNTTGVVATFYVVVDSFYGEVYSWQLEWSISAP